MDKIIQYNINGFYNNFVDLNLLSKDYDPLIFALQETHLTGRSTPTFSGFQIFWKNHPSNTAKGGTAILTKSSLQASEVPLRTSLECTAVQTRIHGKNLTVCSLYLNPNERINYENLQNLLSQLPTPFLILGDYNAHSTTWGCISTNTRGRVIERFVFENDLVVMNNGSFTHISSSYGSLAAIDLSICSPVLSLSFNWEVARDIYNSDHFPVILTSLDASVNITRRRRWKEDQADWVSYQRQIQGRLSLNGSLPVKVQADKFSEEILKVAELFVPRTSIQVRKKYVPWWSVEIKDAINTRKRLFRVYRRNPSAENWSAFRIARRRAKSLVIEAKKKSWQAYVERIDASTTVKEVWDKMRKLSGRFRGAGPVEILSTDGYTTEQKVIADTLAEAFSRNSDDSHLTETEVDARNRLHQLNIVSENYAIEDLNANFSLCELNSALSKVKGKSTGSDQISYSLLKNLPLNERKNLLSLYNEVFSEGQLPELWKNAVVVPILKPGKDPLQPVSYRPISLLSCLGKVMEKMIAVRLTWWLESNELIPRNQSGFRKARSTTDNLAFLQHYTVRALNAGEHVTWVSFDLEKAYERVWRINITNQLKLWGLRGRILKYIENFLTDRSFKVAVGTLSPTADFSKMESLRVASLACHFFWWP
uniref:Reverse transcriptase domain-containing protein n=1 Tax=Lutzomyia longipalpis TaxID=7200 RepID=A0A1B0CBY7_LUTLO